MDRRSARRVRLVAGGVERLDRGQSEPARPSSTARYLPDLSRAHVRHPHRNRTTLPNVHGTQTGVVERHRVVADDPGDVNRSTAVQLNNEGPDTAPGPSLLVLSYDAGTGITVVAGGVMGVP